jgi:hypothetical protein
MRRRWSHMAVIACLVLLTSITKGESLRFLRFLARFFRSLSISLTYRSICWIDLGKPMVGNDSDRHTTTTCPTWRTYLDPGFDFEIWFCPNRFLEKKKPRPYPPIRSILRMPPAAATMGFHDASSTRCVAQLVHIVTSWHQIHVITC